MTVLMRSELEESPLADLHAIADQLGMDGFRRLRKADLIDAILTKQGGEEAAGTDGGEAGQDGGDAAGSNGAGEDSDAEGAPTARARRRRPRSRRGGSARAGRDAEEERAAGDAGPADGEDRAGAQEERGEGDGRIAAGVVEVLGNGSGFLRVNPPEPSDEDVYISAAQVRRCELVSGDRVTGPVRTPRRSERYPSLVRIDTINGASADEVAGAARFDELPAAWPSERLVLDVSDRTLEAIEWLTPLGRGSRAVIVGARFAGKSETLRRIARVLAASEQLAVSVVLVGVRPEEIADWQDGEPEPAAALDLSASPDSQGQSVERALDAAKRAAARGGDVVVLIDTLDGLHPHAARRALASARNLRDAGSLTVIATAARPLGGETTVIALDSALTSSGRQPILDLTESGTLRPELLVGEDGAQAITRARAAAFEAA